MLTPIGHPLPHNLQDRSCHVLETLEGLGMGQQLDLACRTLLAVLLMHRTEPSVPKAQREAFKTICTEVQVWLRDEIAELRRMQSTSKATPHARLDGQRAMPEMKRGSPSAPTTNRCGCGHGRAQGAK